MSRSRKKLAIVKDRNPFFKRLSNRLIRKSGNDLTLLDPDLILLPKKQEFVNQYNISDYKFLMFLWYDKSNDLLKKAIRK